MATLVNVENFARAESDRMFAALAADASVGELVHHRAPASIEHYAVRLYRPRPEVIDGSWTFPLTADT